MFKKMKGFTLIEILIACAIFSILILSVFRVISVGSSSWFIGDASVALRQEVIKTFMRLERELRQTRPSQINLAFGTSATSLTFKVPQDNNADGTILDSSGNIEWSTNIVYALNNTSHQITRTASNVTSIIANDVTGLRFSRNFTSILANVSLANILQVDINVSKTTPTGRQLKDKGQIQMEMRN